MPPADAADVYAKTHSKEGNMKDLVDKWLSDKLISTKDDRRQESLQHSDSKSL